MGKRHLFVLASLMLWASFLTPHQVHAASARIPLANAPFRARTASAPRLPGRIRIAPEDVFRSALEQLEEFMHKRRIQPSN